MNISGISEEGKTPLMALPTRLIGERRASQPLSPSGFRQNLSSFAALHSTLNGASRWRPKVRSIRKNCGASR